jgi:hypothetical protein
MKYTGHVRETARPPPQVRASRSAPGVDPATRCRARASAHPSRSGLGDRLAVREAGTHGSPVAARGSTHRRTGAALASQRVDRRRSSGHPKRARRVGRPRRGRPGLPRVRRGPGARGSRAGRGRAASGSESQRRGPEGADRPPSADPALAPLAAPSFFHPLGHPRRARERAAAGPPPACPALMIAPRRPRGTRQAPAGRSPHHAGDVAAPAGRCPKVIVVMPPTTPKLERTLGDLPLDSVDEERRARPEPRRRPLGASDLPRGGPRYRPLRGKLDFVSDSQILAQAARFGFRIGDAPVPARRFPEGLLDRVPAERGLRARHPWRAPPVPRPPPRDRPLPAVLSHVGAGAGIGEGAARGPGEK